MDKQYNQMENQQKDPKQIAKGCGVLTVVALVMFITVKACFSGDSKPQVKEKDLKMHALSLSHFCVKEKLKSPASAQFPPSIEHVKIINDSLFEINSYVDAQNAFGASIRTKYKCIVSTTDNGDSFICNEVILYE